MWKFIRTIFSSIANSKQRRANYEVALELWRVEYKNEPFDRVLNMVTTGKYDDAFGSAV